MKLFDYRKAGVTRAFLPAASAYRANAIGQDGVSFSAEALKQQFDFESKGIGSPDPKTNGYTLGKWRMDVTLKAMREDLASGLFCKHELMQGSPAMMRRVIRSFVAAPLFGYKANLEVV